MVKNYNELLYKNERMETERLVLRKWQEKDAGDLLEIASDAKTMEYLVWDGLSNHKAALDSIYNYYWSRPGIWAIEHKQDGIAIGCIDLRLKHEHHKASFGYMLNRSYWGCGYMTEALCALLRLCFCELGLNRVEAGHYVGNEASGRVMEKAGMKKEGMSRQTERIKGIFRDMVYYGIVKEDYF